MMAAMMATAFAQGPIQKRIDFSINVPFALRMGDYILPAGKYVLYQISQNDLNLFALHPVDRTHSPIAMIRTTRIIYQGTDYPEKTELIINIDESSRDNHLVLEGWNIPGMDGWEIIGVVEKKRGLLARAN